jgi:hydroxyacylglutathione hydrolase
MIQIKQIPVLQDNYIYLIHETESGETAVVDPAVAEPVLIVLERNNWQLTYILNTHHHADHVGGNHALKIATQCKVLAAKADSKRIPGIDMTLQNNNTFTLGRQIVKIIECPGHTLGHIAFYLVDVNALFCGDTLFSMGCGRLFEGSAEQMWQSLSIFMKLPLDTKIYCAHEYSLDNAKFALTIEPNNTVLIKTIEHITQLRADNTATVPTSLKQELATNPFLRTNSAEIRSSLNLKNATELDVFTELRKRKDRF